MTTTPLLDILTAHLPAVATELSKSNVETLLAFALGAECPLADDDVQWSVSQPVALNAIRAHLAKKKRARDDNDNDDDGTHPKRQKTDSDDPPAFTLPSVSTTSPIRKKVDLTVHARTIRFTNPTTRALEHAIPLAAIARAFLLPTRGRSKGHWTVVLLSADADVPNKSQQIIFGLDAISTAKLETTSYSSGTPTTTTLAKGGETVSSIRALLARIPVPLFEPSATVFRSACATAKSGDGAAGIDAYLSAKPGTLWFFDAGILWGESKPCEFWSVSDLVPKDGVRLLSATGRTCSVIITRKTAEEDLETVFSMVDGREQDPIQAWARNRKHLFGKNASSPTKDARPQNGTATVKDAAWDDSDPEDDDFEASSEDLEHSSSDSDSECGSDGGDPNESEAAEESGQEDVGDGEEEEEEELDPVHHPLLRPGAMPRMSKAAIDMVVDMVQGDLADDASEEEDELEE